MLLVVVMYGMLYFSWQAFQDYSYGASDMYVHHQWAYGLLQGEPYSAGIYPEACGAGKDRGDPAGAQ